MQLPIVDYTSPNAAKDFCESLHHTGFAVLRRHPLSSLAIQRIYDAWNAFFHSEAKYNYAQNAVSADGYFSPQVSETAKGHSQRDLKEFFHIFSWGRYPSEVSPAARDHFTLAQDLAGILLGWVQDNSPPEVRARFSMPLPQMLEGSQHTLLRVLHYPPLQGNEPAGALRSAPHADINLLTLLPSATRAGLQILGKDQAWHDVPCDPDLLIVNIGDMLAEASGNYYPSTVHRVLNPTGEDRLQSRISLPLFLHPRRDVVLSDRYTVGSYFDERMRELQGHA